MERDVERRAKVRSSDGVGVGDGPRQVAMPTPAAAGSQAPYAADGVTEGERGGDDIERRQSREMVAAEENDSRDHRGDKSAEEHAPGPNDTEERGRIVEIPGELDQNQQELGAEEGPNHQPKCKIDQACAVHTGPVGAEPQGPQTDDHRGCEEQPVRWELEEPEVNQNRMHPPPPAYCSIAR